MDNPNMNQGMDQNMGGMNMGDIKPKGSAGPIIGIVVILAIILVGGIYYYMNIKSGLNSANQNGNEKVNTESTGANQEADATLKIESQSSSDDVNSIENDLNSFGSADIDSSTSY